MVIATFKVSVIPVRLMMFDRVTAYVSSRRLPLAVPIPVTGAAGVCVKAVRAVVGEATAPPLVVTEPKTADDGMLSDAASVSAAVALAKEPYR